MAPPRNKYTDRHPLTKWMDKIGLGVKEFAQLIGVSEDLVYRWRQCERSITEEHLDAIVKMSNGRLTMDDLVQPYIQHIQRKRKQYRLDQEAKRIQG